MLDLLTDPSDDAPEPFETRPGRVLTVAHFKVLAADADPVNGVYVEQDKLHNHRPMYVRVKNGPDSDPMYIWYVNNPNPGKAGLWMINNFSQFEQEEPTAKAVCKDIAMCPNDTEAHWRVFDPELGTFREADKDARVWFPSEEEATEITVQSLVISGRLGYNRAMNGIYIRTGIHSGKSFWKHTENTFNIRWFENKWVIDWRDKGPHNDNIGAAVCKENIPEPWMNTIPWRIYDGKAKDKKWKWDELLKIKVILPDGN